MKPLRIFIFVSAIFSVLYVALNAYDYYLYYFDKLPYWMTAEIMYQGIYYKNWRNAKLFGGVIRIALGLISILSCIGLWYLKEWGRYLWLFVSLIIGTFNLYGGFDYYFIFNRSELLKFEIFDWVFYSIYFIISCISWVYLTRRNVVAYFNRAT